jgi:hypothetical protein
VFATRQRRLTSAFQYTVPSAWIDSWIVSGLTAFGWLDACGRSTLTACVIMGAVMMKITSSTSITSISGIMLISALSPSLLSFVSPPKAITRSLPRARRRCAPRLCGYAGVVAHPGRHEGEQVMRKAVEFGQHLCAWNG